MKDIVVLEQNKSALEMRVFYVDLKLKIYHVTFYQPIILKEMFREKLKAVDTFKVARVWASICLHIILSI